MELPTHVINGLSAINNNDINDELFKKILDNSFAAILDKPDIHSLTACTVRSDVMKEVKAAILTFILEITRVNADTVEITAVLDKYGLSEAKKTVFLSMYAKQNERVRIQLSKIGEHNPHIVDVHWKMDHLIKTNNSNQIASIFRISLQTEVNKNDENTKETIDFSCNTYQLQDLLYKLKDALKHCERLNV